MQNYERIIQYAMEQELYGHDFYKKNANLFDEANTRKIFETLSDVELEHYKYLQKLLESYKESGTFEEEIEMPEDNFTDAMLQEYDDNVEELDVPNTPEGAEIPDIKEGVGDSDNERIFDRQKEENKLEATIEQSMTPDLNVLRMAYLIERDFQEFYQNVADRVDDDKLREVFVELSGWEDGHAKLFKREYDRRMSDYMNMPWGG